MQQPNKASTAEARKNSKKERKKKNIEPKRDRRTDQRAPIYLYLNQEERERERER
jgi:gentisate 1,2-dioxygenase